MRLTLLSSVKPAAREANSRASVRANNIANPTSLSAPSTKNLRREARGKALLSANIEALLISLTGKTLHRARFASKGRTKAVTSPRKATPPGEAILASPIAKRKVFKARPKASQPNRANFQSPRVSMMDRLGPVNTDLRDYLSNK